MCRILSIDDSTTNNALLESVLQSKGYEIITTETLEGAEKVLSEVPVNLILLDLLFPEMDGFQFLEKLKSDQRFAGIPVVVVSAACDQKNIKRVRELGAAAFVAKPINISYFIEQVENALMQ